MVATEREGGPGLELQVELLTDTSCVSEVWLRFCKPVGRYEAGCANPSNPWLTYVCTAPKRYVPIVKKHGERLAREVKFAKLPPSSAAPLGLQRLTGIHPASRHSTKKVRL